MLLGATQYYYGIYPTFTDRQAWANGVDPDQMPQNAAFDQVHTVGHSSSSFF